MVENMLKTLYGVVSDVVITHVSDNELAAQKALVCFVRAHLLLTSFNSPAAFGSVADALLLVQLITP